MNNRTEHPPLSSVRHSLAHILLMAIKHHFPHALPAIGPVTDTGFYYDIDFVDGVKMKEEDFPKIEKTMRKNLPVWTDFTHQEVSKDEAITAFSNTLGVNPYKAELINEIAERGEVITLYTCGGFTDLCRGGHANHPSEDLKTIGWKLDRVAGAYWRGDEKNKMLTRIYGLHLNHKRNSTNI